MDEEVTALLPSQKLEMNCCRASLFDAWRQFGCGAHARPCVSGGSCSTLH